MKYIGLKPVEAEPCAEGYKVKIRGKDVVFEEDTFSALFASYDNEREMMRREADFIVAQYTDLIQKIRSSKFKVNYPSVVVRHLIKSQADFLGEYIHLLRKRMMLATEAEHDNHDVELSKISVVRLRKVSNRAKSFLKMSNGNVPHSHCFVFYGQVNGERKRIAVKWTKYGSDTMSEIESLCREYYADGFRNIEVDQMMEYIEGHRDTLTKVYGYSVKI